MTRSTISYPGSEPGRADGAVARFEKALRLQGVVVGALIMRELHTRFGRENIGYLWLFGEPLLLAFAVAIMHAGAKLGHAGGLPTIPFVIGGYCYFMAFRSIASRAESVIEANRTLLHFPRVTLFDMLLARAILEGAAIIVVFAVLLVAAGIFGLADPPGRPLVLLASMGYLVWFSFALSMVVAAIAARSHLFARILHPVLYLSLPLSGAFYVMAWLPPALREIAVTLPTAHIFELSRLGLFGEFRSPHIDLGYLTFWCMGLTYAGLILLRRARRNIHVS